jgi:hypothetical protein
MANQDQDVAAKPRRKRATKRATVMRDMRIVRALAHGETIDEIALREGLSLKRARERVACVVARRTLEPTEAFIAVQVARLNEMMLVAYAAVKDGNMAAVDRVLKITREYDRYHGLALTLARGKAAEADALAAPIALAALEAPAALAAPSIETDGEDARDPASAIDSSWTDGHALATVGGSGGSR